MKKIWTGCNFEIQTLVQYQKKNFKKRESRIIFVVAEELMEHQLKWVPVMDK